jgi:hypothetical protein
MLPATRWDKDKAVILSVAKSKDQFGCRRNEKAAELILR